MAIPIYEPEPFPATTYASAEPYGNLPSLSQDVFAEHPRASYMVALVAVGDEVIMPEAFDAYRQLRLSKYEEFGWLDEKDAELNNGVRIERLDRYDSTSEHTAVIKNVHGGRPRVVAVGRSIIKATAEDLLPVEEVYPEYFGDTPVPIGSNEVSRLISASHNRPERALASMAVQRAITASCVRQDYGPTFAMIEGYLADRLKKTRFPHDMVTDFKPIEHYNNTENAVMSTDWRRVLKETYLGAIGVPLRTGLFFHGVDKPGGGYGFFGKHFLRKFGTQPEAEDRISA